MVPHRIGPLAERVLESAVHIAAAQGEGAVSLEGVAKHAGVGLEEIRQEFATSAELTAAISPYLSLRKARFLQEAVDAAGDADLNSRLRAFMEAYFDYMQREPELFRYLFENRTCVLEEGWDKLKRGEATGNPSLDLVYSAMVGVAQEYGMVVGRDVSARLLAALGIAGWAAVHGMAQLSTVGVLRHQHEVARRYNLREVCRVVLPTLTETVKAGCLEDLSEKLRRFRDLMLGYFADHPRRPQPSEVGDLEALPAEEARAMALETAIMLGGLKGLEYVTLDAVARYHGVSAVFIASVADNDFILREQAELATDAELTSRMEYLFNSLPEGSTAMERLGAMAVAYFHYAVTDPIHFCALLAVASHSVVPISEDGESHAEMSESFIYLMRLTRSALQTLGLEPEDRLVYLKNLTLWAGANGIGHLCAVGEFRNLSEDEKWEIFYAVASVVLGAFHLELS